MKIAFVLKYFLPEQVAGTEIYVAALCMGLQKLGNEVLVIKPGFDIQEIQQHFYEGIKIIEYPESKLVDKELKIGKRKPDGLLAYEDVILNEKPDLIHFHELSGSNGITIDHLRVAQRTKIPVFTTLHLPGYVCKTGMLRYKNEYTCDGLIDTYKCSVCVLYSRSIQFGIGELLSFFGNLVLKNGLDISLLPEKFSGVLSYPTYIEQHSSTLNEVFSISNKVFVLSNWFKDILLKNNLPEDKMVLLPKALPTITHSKKNSLLSVQENTGEIRLVYLGRICEIKGLHTALEALNKVDTDTKWSLDIYGQVTEENYFNKCKNIVSDKGKIFWKGILEPSAVVSTLKSYSALIFPTIIEEMVGLVVQEAFAAGVPVIGSNVRGIAEQVQDGITGLLFESGDVASLCKVLHKVFNGETQLNLLANNIKEPLPFDKVAAYSLEVYKSVLETNIQ